MLDTSWLIAIAMLAAVIVAGLALATLVRVGSLLRVHEDASRDRAGLRAQFDSLASSVANHERDVRGDLAASRTDAGASATSLREELGGAGNRLRDELTAASSRLREEITTALARQQQSLVAQQQALAEQQNAIARQLAGMGTHQQEQLKAFGERIAQLSQSSEGRLEAMRRTIEERLEILRTDNAQKLDLMRATVDEKLQATLEQRLGASFKQVSERLEQVHRGLGEMQNLAAGVGDLKRVLVNVKTRGTWGEVQLGALLQDLLQPSQYAQNVATRPAAKERVEFAIRLPGRNDDGVPCWLPIDAKFPLEDWQRLQDAIERADAASVDSSRRALDAFFKLQAKMIREKYIEPPYTTDFAILFVPTEGLFAEAVARPGLADALQREYRVTLAGPANLAAMLNSLQLGFRTLAIEQRSTEVWRVLGAIKTEFGRFGDLLARTKKKLDEVGDTLGKASSKSTTIARKLREVEALPDDEAQRLLGSSGRGDETGGTGDEPGSEWADDHDASGALSPGADDPPGVGAPSG